MRTIQRQLRGCLPELCDKIIMKAPGGFHLNKGLELPLFAGIRNHGVCARRFFFRKFEFRCAFKKKTKIPSGSYFNFSQFQCSYVSVGLHIPIDRIQPIHIFLNGHVLRQVIFLETSTACMRAHIAPPPGHKIGFRIFLNNFPHATAYVTYL